MARQFVVAAAVGLLAVALGIALRPRWHSGPEGPAEITAMQVASLASAIDLFALGQHRLPRSLEDLSGPALRSGAPYMTSHALDGWGHPLGYDASAFPARRHWIRSRGPDGAWATGDDLAWERSVERGR